MIKSVHYENFKVLRDATLPLGRFTLIVGPNGSGKSTALAGLSLAGTGAGMNSNSAWSADAGTDEKITITVDAIVDDQSVNYRSEWRRDGSSTTAISTSETLPPDLYLSTKLKQELASFRVFSFQASALANAVPLRPGVMLQREGGFLAAVLDSMRDLYPERFEALNRELGRWMPEFDRILFETPGEGMRSVLLRTRAGGYRIPAWELSEGTLLALAYLTVMYLPTPPAIVAFEEPDRGIHPRLLREIQDAMYRLSYPENYGDDRAPVQVIAITHSPYLLDLYCDHPEEIVISEKEGMYGSFRRLLDTPYIDEVLKGAPLGEIWYSGVLGGVPAGV